jgi:hypothetical protein
VWCAGEFQHHLGENTTRHISPANFELSVCARLYLRQEAHPSGEPTTGTTEANECTSSALFYDILSANTSNLVPSPF